MTIERKIIDCNQSGTTARTLPVLIASGIAGEGIYVLTGKKRLSERPHEDSIKVINMEAVKKIVYGESIFRYLSIAVPANEKFHMPITIYVGNAACNELTQEIKDGKYDFFKPFFLSSV